MRPLDTLTATPHAGAWAVLPETLAAITARVLGGPAAVEDLDDVEAPDPAAESVPGVAVLTLRGLITPRPSFLSLLFGGGGGLEAFQQSVFEAATDDTVSAIVLNIDSPGGRIDLVPETAQLVREAREVKPVVAVANTMSASAAYWIGAQADEFVVTPSGSAGSIGVYTAHMDVSGALEQAGMRATLVSAGRFKTEGNPYEPLGREARQHLQSVVDDAYRAFTADVAAGRGVSADQVRRGFGEGRLLPAERAVQAGIADRVGTLEDVIAGLLAGWKPARRRRSDAPDASAAAATSVSASDHASEAATEAPTTGELEADTSAGGDAGVADSADADRLARERLAALL